MKYIEIVIFFVSFGFFIHFPIFGQLLFSKVCKENYKLELSECLNSSDINNKIQKLNNKWVLYIHIVQWIPSLICPLIINFMATKFSPEKLLFVPCVGFIILLTIGIIYAKIPNVSFCHFVI